MSASAAILSCLQACDVNPIQQFAKLRSLLDEDSREFLSCVGQDSSGDLKNRGFRYALLLLRNSGRLVPYLADPRKSSFEQALRLTKYMAALEDDFIDQLLSLVPSNDSSIDNGENDLGTKKLRLLDLVLESEIQPTNWWLVSKVLESEDSKLRVRCISLITRHRLDPQVVFSFYEQGDARARADLVEVLSRNHSPHLQEVIHRALADGSNRVAANACLAAYIADDERSLSWLADMIETRMDETFRISAAWAIGQTRDVRFAESLLEARRSTYPKVRAAAIKSLTKLDRFDRCPVAADIRLARSLTFPSTANFEDDLDRTIFVNVEEVEPNEGVPMKPIDFILFHDATPVLKYQLQKPGNGSVRLRVACPASVLHELADSLARHGSELIQSIAVYGEGLSEQKSMDGISSLPILWAGSLDEAVQSLQVPGDGDTDRHSLLVIDPTLSSGLDLQRIDEACKQAGAGFHFAETQAGVQLDETLKYFSPGDAKAFWEGYLTAAQEAWRITLRGKLNGLSLQIRRRVGMETSFSEKVVWQ